MIRFDLDHVRRTVGADSIPAVEPRSTLADCESDLSDLRWLEGDELAEAAIDLAERAIEGWRHLLSTCPVDQPSRPDRETTPTEA